MSDFWAAQCPARGPALTHAHGQSCPGEHEAGQCCHCGLFAKDWTGTPPVPLDVQQRLQSLGLIPDPREFDLPPRVSDAIEPKMISGHGPQGRESGPGRGSLTPRQRRNLIARAQFTDYLDMKEAEGA